MLVRSSSMFGPHMVRSSPPFSGARNSQWKVVPRTVQRLRWFINTYKQYIYINPYKSHRLYLFTICVMISQYNVYGFRYIICPIINPIDYSYISTATINHKHSPNVNYTNFAIQAPPESGSCVRYASNSSGNIIMFLQFCRPCVLRYRMICRLHSDVHISLRRNVGIVAYLMQQLTSPCPRWIPARTYEATGSGVVFFCRKTLDPI